MSSKNTFQIIYRLRQRTSLHWSACMTYTLHVRHVVVTINSNRFFTKQFNSIHRIACCFVAFFAFSANFAGFVASSSPIAASSGACCGVTLQR
jgi:hypothetical protein